MRIQVQRQPIPATGVVKHRPLSRMMPCKASLSRATGQRSLYSPKAFLTKIQSTSALVLVSHAVMHVQECSGGLRRGRVQHRDDHALGAAPLAHSSPAPLGTLLQPGRAENLHC
jgi:hypothetical protein